MSEAKAMASSIAFMFNWFCAFLVTKFYPDLEELINASGAYLMFSIICFLGKRNRSFFFLSLNSTKQMSSSFLGTIFIVFLVPETKGKSPEELKKGFISKKNLHKHEKRISESSDMSEKGEINTGFN